MVATGHGSFNNVMANKVTVRSAWSSTIDPHMTSAVLTNPVPAEVIGAQAQGNHAHRRWAVSPKWSNGQMVKWSNGQMVKWFL